MKLKERSGVSSGASKKHVDHFDNLENILPNDHHDSRDKEDNKNGISLYTRSSSFSSMQDLKELAKPMSSKKPLQEVKTNILLPSSVKHTDEKKKTVSHKPADDRFKTSRQNILEETKMPEPKQSKKEEVFVEDEEDEEEVHSFDDTDLLKLAVEEEDDFEEVDKVFSKARHNHIDYFMELLPTKSFDFNQRDAHGNSILHICAQNNNRRLATLIYQYSTDLNLNIKNNKLMTPLDYSEKYGFDKLSDWLLSKGAVSGMAKTPKAKQFR